MFERFTEKAIKVIMEAQYEARKMGHSFVGTEQILLGLIGEGTSIAARTLKACGVNLEDARVEVQKIIGRGSGCAVVEIPFTPRAKRLLELTWDEARELRHNFIGTEHILLGLIREGDGVGPQVLLGFALDLAELRCRLLEDLVDSYKTDVTDDPSNMHSFGSLGRLLFFLDKYSEATECYSKALFLPGGEVYKEDADLCRQHLNGMETDSL
jgi:ATP-dependent Clp protease ATP-binding subunit ClpC